MESMKAAKTPPAHHLSKEVEGGPDQHHREEGATTWPSINERSRDGLKEKPTPAMKNQGQRTFQESSKEHEVVEAIM